MQALLFLLIFLMLFSLDESHEYKFLKFKYICQINILYYFTLTCFPIIAALSV